MVRGAHKCGRVLRDEHKWQKQPSKWEIGNPNALALGFVGQYAWLTADGLQSCERNYDRREHSAGVQHQRTDSDIERQSTKSTQIEMISTPNCMIQTYAKSQPLARTIPKYLKSHARAGESRQPEDLVLDQCTHTTPASVGHKEHQKTTNQTHGWSKWVETERWRNLRLNSFKSRKVSIELENIQKYPKVSKSICLQTTPGHKMSQVCMA